MSPVIVIGEISAYLMQIARTCHVVISLEKIHQEAITIPDFFRLYN
jgi:hypothetical protein